MNVGQYIQTFNATVLISTYWNVNFDLVCSPASVVLVLISTYWNVNANASKLMLELSDGFNLNLLECK